MLYLAYALLTLHMFVGILLIGLILLQRGRGGGLAGAFGGMGGQSAFGTKAGDFFTRLTIGLAVFWIVLACVCIRVVEVANKGLFKSSASDAVKKAPAIGASEDKESTTGGLQSGKNDDLSVPPSPNKPEGASGSSTDSNEKPQESEKKDDKPKDSIDNNDAAKDESSAPAAEKKDDKQPEATDSKKPE